MDEAKQVWQEEAREEGREEALEEHKQQMRELFALLESGVSIAEVKAKMGLS